MSADIVWSRPAFEELQAFLQAIAFEILARVDYLASYPELGPLIQSNYKVLSSCRQIVVRRQYRFVYEFSADRGVVTVLAVQRCRQRRPSTRDIRRRRSLDNV